jgi:hypothetical protein
MITFKQFIESKTSKKKDKEKIHLALNIEGEPVVVSDKKKTKDKLKRVFDDEGEPETI